MDVLEKGGSKGERVENTGLIGTSESHHVAVPPPRPSAIPLWYPRTHLQAALTSWFGPRPRDAGAFTSCSSAHAG